MTENSTETTGKMLMPPQYRINKEVQIKGKCHPKRARQLKVHACTAKERPMSFMIAESLMQHQRKTSPNIVARSACVLDAFDLDT